MTALQITIGRNRKNPRGRLVTLPDGITPAAALTSALQSQPRVNEAWWAGHTWRENHRTDERWESACTASVDVDYHDDKGEHVAAPAELAARALAAARAQQLPGSVFHLTPRGFRLIFCFAQPVTDRDQWKKAARGAGAQVATALATLKLTGYQVDQAALQDTARLLYSPCALVAGEQRSAEVLLVRDAPYLPAQLEPPPTPTPPTKPRAPSATFQEASDRFNQAHPGDWPRNSGDCPACGHKECFGQLPSDPSRWACFSASHVGPGVKGPGCTHGDALDMAAHQAGCTPAELLRRHGLLGPTLAPPPPSVPASAGQAPAAPVPIKGIRKSYASLCAILRHDARVVPEPIEWNEMLCSPTVGGVEMQDADTGRLREKIELLVSDSKGRALQFGSRDIEQSVQQVAWEHKYHPVREYLEQLEWDGTKRIEALAEDILGLPRTQINLALIKRWLVGAVARIYDPGCELQMVLVLAGAQYAGKSRFFKTLTGADWFSDRKIDIEDQDALMLLQRVWVLEWGELAVVQRARDVETVKQFITSTMNDFRPPYGRRIQRAPRHCTIVGTTNKQRFLNDPTGDRRFWPLRIPDGWAIRLDLVAEQRDQLWAEAKVLYRTGEQWHLTDEERELLVQAQVAFRERHPWEEPISEWLETWNSEITTHSVLEYALKRPAGLRTRGDEMAVARVLKSLGFEKPKDVDRPVDGNGKRSRVWKKKPVSSGDESGQPGQPRPTKNGEVGQ